MANANESREALEDQARSLGVNPDDYSNKEELASAINDQDPGDESDATDSPGTKATDSPIPAGMEHHPVPDDKKEPGSGPLVEQRRPGEPSSYEDA